MNSGEKNLIFIWKDGNQDSLWERGAKRNSETAYYVIYVTILTLLQWNTLSPGQTIATFQHNISQH